jgi:hypothetical protein
MRRSAVKRLPPTQPSSPNIRRCILIAIGKARRSAFKPPAVTSMLLARNMDTMIPWLSPLIEENRHLLRDDWWPYGIEANRKALDTFLRYHFEQGLSKRRLTCEDIFVPELLNT